MSRRHAASWAGWVVGAMIAGCGSDSTQVAAPVDAFSSKACVSDMQEIGPAGGVLSAGPYLLTVPAGALLSSRMLTLEQESCGQWPLRLGPEGTQFLLPATLEFDASTEPTNGSMHVAWWNPSTNGWVDQVTYHKGTTVGASITHFSRWIIN